MSTISDPGFPTLANVAKRLKPDGSVETDMVDLLSKKTPILEDIPWVQCNNKTGHLITSVNALPSPTWRRLNEGISPTKGETVQYEETCGMLQDRSDIDVKLVELFGSAYRATEDKIKLESFGQTLETAIFYENALTNPQRIHGLAQRYPATTGYTASSYVLKPGTNSGTNCHSVWLINWDPNYLFGIFPEGSVGGLKQQDKGRRYTVSPVNSKEMEVYTTQYDWDCGLAVRDYRYSCRMQWDPDDSTNFADSAKGMFLSMQDMIGTVYDMDATKARFYMNRTSFNKLTKQLASNTTNFLEYIEAGKRRIPAFLGVPIRITDSLVQESAIS
jgi:hypothetical protein